MLTQKPTETNNYNNILDFETVLNHSFTNYKKIALYAGLALFVFTFFFVRIQFAGSHPVSMSPVNLDTKLNH